MKYSEEYGESKGKGSFPAMITPGYQAAKNANTLASNVSNLTTKTELLAPYIFVVGYLNLLKNELSKTFFFESAGI